LKFYVPRNHFRFRLTEYMRQEFAPEEPTSMSTFHRLDERRAKLPLGIRAEKRLPIGQSMAVIAGLSILAWGVVVLLVVAARAIF
jgi:hypothetical protein